MAPAGTSYFSTSRPFSSTSETSPLRVSTIRSPASLVTTFSRVYLTMPPLLALMSLFFDVVLTDAADVERPHRELRARLADALGGDDADRHALFDQRTGRKVHAVAAAANAERRVAGHARCGPGSSPGPALRSCGRCRP